MNKKAANIIFHRYFFILIIFVVSTLLAIFFIQKNLSRLNEPVGGDASAYDDMATNLYEGKGLYMVSEFWTWATIKAPSFPVFLAVIFEFFGHNYLAVRLIEICFWVINSLLVFLIAEKIFNKFFAFLTALIFSFYQSYDGHLYLEIYREPLFILFYLLFTYFILQILEKPTWKNFIFSGIIFGFLSLNRPAIAFALPFFILWLIVVLKKTKRMKVKKIFIGLGVTALIIISSWLIRNKLVTGSPIIEFTGIFDGWSMASGNRDKFLKDFSSIYPDTLWVTPAASEGELAQRLNKETFNNFIKHPYTWLKVGVEHIFSINCLNGTCRTIWEPAIIIIGLIGFVIGLIFLPLITVYFLISLGVTIIISAFFGADTSRFRTPFDWLYLMYGIFAIYIIFISLFKRKLLPNLLNSNQLLLNDEKIILNRYLKILGWVAFILILVPLSLGTIKLGYANIFCDSQPLTNITNDEAEKLLSENNFSLNNNYPKWVTFDEIKNYVFYHNFELDQYNYSIVKFTGVIRNLITLDTIDDDKYIDTMVWGYYPKNSTGFSFVITEKSCSPGRGRFYTIFPDKLPSTLQDKNVILIGQIQNNQTINMRFGVKAIAIIPLNERGQPQIDQGIFAKEADNLKQLSFYN